MDKVLEERLQVCRELGEKIEQAKHDLIEAAAKDAGFPKKITSIEVDLSVEHLKTMEEEIKYDKGKKLSDW